MSFEWLHNLELPWMLSLHAFRNTALDQFFIFLNFLDRTEFYFFLISLIWYLFSPNWGLRLFYLVIANGLINGLLKQIFQQPRPYEMIPELGLLSLNSFGFPSGAAQSAALLAFILIKEWKTAMAWLIGSLYFILLSFSRVYLGLHFPSDIVMGWIVGALLALSFYRLGLPFERWMKSTAPSEALLVALALFVALLILAPTSTNMNLCFTALGGAVGLYLSSRYLSSWPIAKTYLGKSLQAFLLTASVLFLYISGVMFLANLLPAHQQAFKSITFFMIGLISTFGLPYLFGGIIVRTGTKSSSRFKNSANS